MSKTERHNVDHRLRLKHKQQVELGNIYHMPTSRATQMGMKVGAVPWDVDAHMLPSYDTHAYPEFRNLLNQEADLQESLMSQGRFDQFKDKTGDDFLNAFVLDPIFNKIYSLAREEAGKIIDENEFNSSLRGAIFEQMAYAYTSSLADGTISIMGDSVLRMTKTLKPKANEFRFGFGQTAVEGLYIPDGFLIKEHEGRRKITGIVECSLGRWDSKPRRREQAVGGRKLSKTLANYSENPKLNVVSPIYDSPVRYDLDCDVIDVVPVVVPVGINVLMEEFMPFVYSSSKGPDGKTLLNLRQEWRESASGKMASLGEPGLFQA